MKKEKNWHKRKKKGKLFVSRGDDERYAFVFGDGARCFYRA
jgi:hypothetical protein